MLKIILMMIYILLTVSGVILFKLGSNSTYISITTKNILNLQLNIFTLIGIFIYGLSFIIYIVLLSKNTLSYIVPIMTGLVYISVFTASIFILKEKVNIISIIGCVIILIGILLVITQQKNY